MSAVRTLAAALGAGLPLDIALGLGGGLGDERTVVDDIVEFAKHTGVPRVAALTALADSLDERERRERAIETGTASARQTARILAVMPAATVIGAQLFGFDVVTVLVGTPIGWACLGFGAALSVIAWWWMRRIRESLYRPAIHAGLVVDLAAGIAQSTSITEPRRLALRRIAESWGTGSECGVIDDYRSLSRETGVPVVGLLAVEAGQIRRRAHARVLHELELLPGRLLPPIGACLFPAFVVTTVIPVVVTMATGFTR